MTTTTNFTNRLSMFFLLSNLKEILNSNFQKLLRNIDASNIGDLPVQMSSKVDLQLRFERCHLKLMIYNFNLNTNF